MNIVISGSDDCINIFKIGENDYFLQIFKCDMVGSFDLISQNLLLITRASGYNPVIYHMNKETSEKTYLRFPPNKQFIAIRRHMMLAFIDSKTGSVVLKKFQI